MVTLSFHMKLASACLQSFVLDVHNYCVASGGRGCLWPLRAHSNTVCAENIQYGSAQRVTVFLQTEA